MATAFGVRALGRQPYAHRRNKPFNSHTVSISSPSMPTCCGRSIHRGKKMKNRQISILSFLALTVLALIGYRLSLMANRGAGAEEPKKVASTLRAMRGR